MQETLSLQFGLAEPEPFCLPYAVPFQSQEYTSCIEKNKIACGKKKKNSIFKPSSGDQHKAHY